MPVLSFTTSFAWRHSEQNAHPWTNMAFCVFPDVLYRGVRLCANDDLNRRHALGFYFDAFAIEDDDGFVLAQRLQHRFAQKRRHLRLVEAFGNLSPIRQRDGEFGWEAAHDWNIPSAPMAHTQKSRPRRNVRGRLCGVCGRTASSIRGHRRAADSAADPGAARVWPFGAFFCSSCEPPPGSIQQWSKSIATCKP